MVNTFKVGGTEVFLKFSLSLMGRKFPKATVATVGKMVNELPVQKVASWIWEAVQEGHRLQDGSKPPLSKEDLEKALDTDWKLVGKAYKLMLQDLGDLMEGMGVELDELDPQATKILARNGEAQEVPEPEGEGLGN